MIKFYQSLSPRWHFFLPYLVLAMAVFTAYCNVYDNDFLFDDGLIITRNDLLHYWSTLGKLLTSSTTDGAHIAGGFYRPVQTALYFFIYQIAGLSRFAFHLLNVSIHMANACLLFEMGRRLKFNLWASFFAALLWAMHPIHTEAVTYMSSTADTLHTFFCLLGIVLLLPDISQRKIFWVIPIFILGLLSKEVAIVFPALVMACLYYTSDKKLDPKTYAKTWPLWVMTALYIGWRLTATSLDGPGTYARIYQLPEYRNMQLYSQHFELRLYTFFATLPDYLRLLVWPTDLHMERRFNIFADFWLAPVLLGFVMTCAALGQVILGHGKKNLPFSWGLLWFGAAHFPDTGLIVPINSLFLEHWMYLPTAGLFLGIAQTLTLHLSNSRFEKAKPVLAGVAIIVSAALGTATVIQNRVWHDPVTFYTHVFHYDTTSARAHNNLALAYVDRKDYALAIEEFHKAITISDTYAETHHNLAVSLLNMPDRENHVDEAIANLNRALEIDPNFFRSDIVLSQIYAYQKQPEKAVLYRDKAEAILNAEKH